MRKLLVPLVAVALVAAGCGGSKSGSASGGASGATIAPASALAFASVDTDESSTQWKNAETLLRKFPSHDKLFAAINSALSNGSGGVDFNKDVRPLLGPEVDFVVLPNATGSPQFVAMTQATDKGKFEAELAKGTPPSVHIEVGDWVVFSDTQAALDAFKEQSDKGKLSDDSTFQDATSGLPSEANATAYVNGSQLLGALRQSVPQLGALPTGQLQWLAAALSSQSDSVKLDGAAKTGQSAVENYTPSLLAKVPSDALVVLSFHGSAQLTQQLTQNPQLAQAAGQLQQLLGVGLTQIADLIRGEGVLYVAPRAPFPEATLVLDEAHPATALGTLNTLATKLSAATHHKLKTAFPGAAIKELNLGPVAIYYGLSGGTLVISDASAHIVGPVGTAITSNSTFTKARTAAGLPDQSAGFVYVNIKQAIPTIQGFAQVAGSAIPPEVAQNLAPLESFLAYATSSGGTVKFTVLLHTH